MPNAKVLTDNIAKTEEWWAKQPAEALETVERVAVMMGIPVHLMGKNYDATEPSSGYDSGHQPYQLTSSSLASKTQAQGASIPFANSPFDDSHHLHFDSLHYGLQRLPCFKASASVQTRMMLLAILHGLRPNPKLKSILEGCADLQHLWGSNATFPQPFFQPIFPTSERLYSFHSHQNPCNPNSTWALQCIISWTESTAAPGNTFNSPMRDLYKLNWHFVIGKNMTICIFGHPSQSTQTEATTAALKWH